MCCLAGCHQQDTFEAEKAALQQAADLKFERVSKRIKEDCDSIVQKETYKRVQQLRQSKARRRAIRSIPHAASN